MAVRKHKNQMATALLLLLALLSPALFPAPAAANALQTENTLQLNVWPTYLGPQVVLSGAAGSAGGVPDVVVLVENLDVVGPPVFQGAPSTALRPPLGLPTASWRVPLTLDNGNYRVTVSSAIGGEALATETADFEVVTETAAPIEIFPVDAVWSYYDAGDEPANQTGGGAPRSWYELAYDASAWSAGPAQLGYGSVQATTTAATGIFGQKIIAQYFRHEFTPPDLTGFEALTLTMLRDDGAVVYLNGTELGRTNMPAGPVNYGTAASSTSDQTITIALTAEDLVEGANVLAVEVHQSSPLSSDIQFSASLSASVPSTPRVSNNTEGTFLLTVGDMARCNFDGDEAVAAQMEELFDTDRGVFIGLGDLVYNSGTIDEFTNCYDPTFGQFLDVTWPAPGNHEHYTFPNAAGYRQYFGPSAGPTAGPNGGLWYSFDIDENWHVIALDSDCDGREVLPGAFLGDGCAVGSDQETWLRADLEANQDKNILAFFHHPAYTNNQYTDHEYTWPLWRALAEYGADITLHGHEHHYERYVPLDYWGEAAAPTATGITEFIIGSGGTFPRYDIRPQEAESAFRGTFPQGTNDFGALQLWLRPDGFEWKWESIYGLAASDSGTAGLNDPTPRASIGGTVVDINDGTPIAAAEVCAVAQRTAVENCVVSAADGTYSIGPIVSDQYTIDVEDPADNFVASDLGYSVLLEAPAATTFDIEMWPRPSISGTVTSQDAVTPIEGATVCARLGSPVTCASTAADGSYTIEGLNPGRTHQVTFEAVDHIAECYDDIQGQCTAAAEMIALTTLDVTDISASLELNPGGITGTVTGQDTGFAVQGVEVCADALVLDEPLCVVTSANGDYSIGDLKSANYTVSFTDPSGVYLPECYFGTSCASPLLVGVIQPRIRIGIDATLDPVPPGGPGDANCSVFVTTADAQALLEYGVGSLADGGLCPVTAAQVNVAAGDINGDGATNLLDALLIAQQSN